MTQCTDVRFLSVFDKVLGFFFNPHSVDFRDAVELTENRFT